jgi:amino acid permease
MSNEKEKFDSSPIRENDSESFKGPTVHHGEGPLHRQLKNRHIAMISIGGVIGTGKFFDAHPTNFHPLTSSFQVFSWVPLALYHMVAR